MCNISSVYLVMSRACFSKEAVKNGQLQRKDTREPVRRGKIINRKRI